MPMIDVVTADLGRPDHGQAVLGLMDSYARDPMGGGDGLGEYAKQHLIAELQKRPGVHIFLAWSELQAVALATCFEGFSTFYSRPLMNIHDLVVDPAYRRQGISGRLLDAVEARAVQLGCCKLTLEVLSGNKIAQTAYRKFGFDVYCLDPKLGGAQFWEKKLV